MSLNGSRAVKLGQRRHELQGKAAFGEFRRFDSIASAIVIYRAEERNVHHLRIQLNTFIPSSPLLFFCCSPVRLGRAVNGKSEKLPAAALGNDARPDLGKCRGFLCSLAPEHKIFLQSSALTQIHFNSPTPPRLASDSSKHSIAASILLSLLEFSLISEFYPSLFLSFNHWFLACLSLLGKCPICLWSPHRVRQHHWFLLQYY